MLPLRAMRAGMTSCKEVAGSFSASATRNVVLNGNGLSSSGTVCRNSIRVARPRVRSPAPAPRRCRFRRPDGTGPRRAVRGQQHRVRRDGRVPDERRLLARVEEPHANVVIRGGGGRSRRRLRHARNSRAMSDKDASLCPSASRMTVAGLPVKRIRVNAST